MAGIIEICPNCRAEEKIVDRCKECGKLCCSECSINGYCIDCSVKLHDMKVAYKKEVVICDY